ncbi:MAG TPA: shikimate kinase [Bacteroidales bacterium]|nr:shikimate kinase [Bacteroidales bacterium]HQH14709.1 shikimate kinase [Bacteroidales bacterium]
MKNVYLIGYMGAGKSTAGRQLARLLGYDFLDLDRAFEETYKISIVDFFDKYDEDTFRLIERKMLENTFSLKSHVISTGGGTVCNGDNIRQINEHGISVYIRMHPDSLFHRLRNSKRPRPRIINLKDAELKRFIEKDLEQRDLFYQMAHLQIKGEDLNFNALAKLIAPKLGISLLKD